MKSFLRNTLLFLWLAVSSSYVRAQSNGGGDDDDGVDLEACAADLAASDGDDSGDVTADEYLRFSNRYASRVKCQTTPASQLTLRQTATFTSLACQCQWETGDAECCLNGRAVLSVAGALDPASRTEEELLFLTVVCVVTDQSVPDECAATTEDNDTDGDDGGTDPDDPTVRPQDEFLQDDNRDFILDAGNGGDDDDDDDPPRWFWWVIVAGIWVCLCCAVLTFLRRRRTQHKNKRPEPPPSSSPLIPLPPRPKFLPPRIQHSGDDYHDRNDDDSDFLSSPPPTELEDEEEEDDFQDEYPSQRKRQPDPPSSRGYDFDDDDDNNNNLETTVETVTSINDGDGQESTRRREEDPNGLPIHGNAHDPSLASSAEDIRILGLAAQDEKIGRDEGDVGVGDTRAMSQHEDDTAEGRPRDDREDGRGMPGASTPPRQTTPEAQQEEEKANGGSPLDPPDIQSSATASNRPAFGLWDALDNPSDSANSSSHGNLQTTTAAAAAATTTPTTTKTTAREDTEKQSETTIPSVPTRGYSTRLDELQHPEPERDPPTDPEQRKKKKKKKKAAPPKTVDAGTDEERTQDESESTAVEEEEPVQEESSHTFDWIFESLS